MGKGKEGTCELCQKKVEIREKECDESGLMWHFTCFRCYECGLEVNEKTCNIRGKDKIRVLCNSHANKDPVQRPCKIFMNSSKLYRVVF